MPVVRDQGIRDVLAKLAGSFNAMPTNPANIIEGYRALLNSDNPAAMYGNAARGLAGNMARDMESFNNRIAAGDPSALLSLILMTNPMKGPGKMAPESANDFASFANSVGKAGKFGEQATAPKTAPSPNDLRALLDKDYMTALDSERNFLAHALSPEYLKGLLPLLMGGGAMAAGASNE